MDPDTAILAVYAVSLEGRASIALVTCCSLSLPIRASEDDAPFVSVSVSAISNAKPDSQSSLSVSHATTRQSLEAYLLELLGTLKYCISEMSKAIVS